MRRGIFGGSFDPVHVGHVELAELCADRARLDLVELMPASQQPLKGHGPRASDHHRLAMLELALDGREKLVVSTLEIDRGGVSYTVDTLRELRRRHPDDELFFLMGADALRDFSFWREPGEILQLALPLVVARVNEPPPDLQMLAPLVSPERLEEIRQGMIASTVAPVSSREIRWRLAAGESVVGMLDPAVADYIRTHRLYREPNEPTEGQGRSPHPH